MGIIVTYVYQETIFVYRCDQGYMCCNFAFEFNEDMGAVHLPKYQIWIVFFEFKEEMIRLYMMLVGSYFEFNEEMGAVKLLLRV